MYTGISWAIGTCRPNVVARPQGKLLVRSSKKKARSNRYKQKASCRQTQTIPNLDTYTALRIYCEWPSGQAVKPMRHAYIVIVHSRYIIVQTHSRRLDTIYFGATICDNSRCRSNIYVWCRFAYIGRETVATDDREYIYRKHQASNRMYLPLPCDSWFPLARSSHTDSDESNWHSIYVPLEQHTAQTSREYTVSPSDLSASESKKSHCSSCLQRILDLFET